MRYAVVVHEDPGSAYGVTVSDLPVWFPGGNTLGLVSTTPLSQRKPVSGAVSDQRDCLCKQPP